MKHIVFPSVKIIYLFIFDYLIFEQMAAEYCFNSTVFDFLVFYEPQWNLNSFLNQLLYILGDLIWISGDPTWGPNP